MEVSELIGRLKGFDLERLLQLRPPYPPLVLQIDREGMLMLRVKRRRRGKPVVEAVASAPLEGMPRSIFQSSTVSDGELDTRLRELFERTGTRPGRVSLVLPDNLAKISLIQLPERPGSRRQLEELVRAKMRRAVPFRLDDAALSYEVVPGGGRSVGILVVLVRRNLVERIEGAFERLGARVGLVDITTPNLLNLCRDRFRSASGEEDDSALLNCTPNYFSLLIVREGRLIFYRCKTYALEEGAPGPNGAFMREMANSFSYYREKLEGRAIRRLLVRSTSPLADDFAGRLRELGVGSVEPIEALDGLELGEGVRVEPELAARMTAAVGAAIARGN
jgi:hypothetical protein